MLHLLRLKETEVRARQLEEDKRNIRDHTEELKASIKVGNTSISLAKYYKFSFDELVVCILNLNISLHLYTNKFLITSIGTDTGQET